MAPTVTGTAFMWRFRIFLGQFNYDFTSVDIYSIVVLGRQSMVASKFSLGDVFAVFVPV